MLYTNTFKLPKRLLTLVVCVSLMGCISYVKMPLTPEAKKLNTQSKGMLFGRLIFVNEVKPEHQPNLQEIILTTKDGRKSFIEPYLIKDEPGKGKHYLFSLSVKPGDATLDLMRFTLRRYLLHGSVDVPFGQTVNASPGHVVYLGNIYVTVLPRDSGQPRAGKMVPLYDQTIMGFANGSLWVSIHDFEKADTALLYKHFPELKGKTVTNRTLDQWNHPDT